MRFVWSSALKDIRRHQRDPMGFIYWMGIPLIIGGLIMLAFGGGGGVKPQAHVLVADEDDSFVSGLLIGAMSQEAAGGLIRMEEVELGAGHARMDKGEATALLVIPDGFGRAVLLEEPISLGLVTNPSERILPAIVEESLGILVDGHFYVHRLIGDDLRAFAGGPPAGGNTFPDERIAAFSVRINQTMDRISAMLFPLVVRLETTIESKDDEQEGPTFGTLLMPGILFMALLFMANGLAADLWQERDQHTLRRIVVSPQSTAAFHGGKLLSGTVMMLFVSLVALGLGYLVFDLAWKTLPLAALWSAFAGVLLTVIMTFLNMLASSQRAANVLTTVLIFPLMMIGGSFFPFEAMPDWMAAVGRLTPNGWALEHLKRIIWQMADAASLGVAFVGLLVVAVVLFVACAVRLRMSFARG